MMRPHKLHRRSVARRPSGGVGGWKDAADEKRGGGKDVVVGCTTAGRRGGEPGESCAWAAPFVEGVEELRAKDLATTRYVY